MNKIEKKIIEFLELLDSKAKEYVFNIIPEDIVAIREEDLGTCKIYTAWLTSGYTITLIDCEDMEPMVSIEFLVRCEQ